MVGLHKSDFKNPVVRWIDERLPIPSLLQKEYAQFPTPKNFNYFWNFGALAMVCLVVMIVTGIFLAMHYTPHTAHAFDSVERIMRDVNYGWLIRYIHMNGASMFFIVVYIHIFRGLYYGSYKAPRELLWILGVVILKIWALHIPGSTNPTGIDVKGPQDTLPFHPYFTAKDGFTLALYLLLFAIVVFFAPNMLGHPDNYIKANPLATPAHIVPEWYFWPFYAILRAFTVDMFFISAKLWGVLAMFASIILLFFLPWLDNSPVRSNKYRPWARIAFWVLMVDIVVLAICGGAPAEEPYVRISQIATAYYFAHFLIILPLIARLEQPEPLPRSISEAVLKGRKAVEGLVPAGAGGARPAAQPAE